MAIAVFGYGSLVDRASASLTLGRELEGTSSTPARLEGWRRRFSQARDNRTCEKTFARADNGEVPEWILGMNIERNDRVGAGVSHNGALIELEPQELDRLDRRELRYDRIEVGGSVRGPGSDRFERIYTYAAKPGHYAPEPPPGAVILRSYVETIEAAFERLGPGQLEWYRRTTMPYPAEVVDAVLVADRIPAGNPRAW